MERNNFHIFYSIFIFFTYAYKVNKNIASYEFMIHDHRSKE